MVVRAALCDLYPPTTLKAVAAVETWCIVATTAVDAHNSGANGSNTKRTKQQRTEEGTSGSRREMWKRWYIFQF